MPNAFEKSMNIAPVMLPSFNDCRIDSVRYVVVGWGSRLSLQERE